MLLVPLVRVIVISDPLADVEPMDNVPVVEDALNE
jgi:hypothetical protein